MNRPMEPHRVTPSLTGRMAAGVCLCVALLS